MNTTDFLYGCRQVLKNLENLTISTLQEPPETLTIEKIQKVYIDVSEGLTWIFRNAPENARLDNKTAGCFEEYVEILKSLPLSRVYSIPVVTKPQHRQDLYMMAGDLFRLYGHIFGFIEGYGREEWYWPQVRLRGIAIKFNELTVSLFGKKDS